MTRTRTRTHRRRRDPSTILNPHARPRRTARPPVQTTVPTVRDYSGFYNRLGQAEPTPEAPEGYTTYGVRFMDVIGETYPPGTPGLWELVYRRLYVGGTFDRHTKCQQVLAVNREMALEKLRRQGQGVKEILLYDIRKGGGEAAGSRDQGAVK